MKGLLGFIFVVSLGLSTASYAQDADLRAQANEANTRYADAWVAGDIDGLLEMFSEDAIFWPADGGRFEGREEIRQAFEEQPAPGSATIETTHVERMDGVILDVGTFTISMPEEAGGEMRGEFVALLAEEGDDILIRRLIGFPVREGPPAQ